MSRPIILRSIVSILVIGGGAVAAAWAFGAFDAPTDTRSTASSSRVITLAADSNTSDAYTYTHANPGTMPRNGAR